jgi:hypothetical protein
MEIVEGKIALRSNNQRLPNVGNGSGSVVSVGKVPWPAGAQVTLARTASSVRILGARVALWSSTKFQSTPRGG